MKQLLDDFGRYLYLPPRQGLSVLLGALCDGTCIIQGENLCQWAPPLARKE